MKKGFLKIIKKIVIGTLVAGFLVLPISNIVYAQNGVVDSVNSQTGPATVDDMGETMTLKPGSEIKDTSATFTFVVNHTSNGYLENYSPFIVGLFDKPFNYADSIEKNLGVLNWGIKDPPAPGVKLLNISETSAIKQYSQGEVNASGISLNDVPQEKIVTFNGLAKSTQYFVVAYLINENAVGLPGSGQFDTLITVNLTFTTAADPNSTGTVDSTGGSSYTAGTEPEFGCGTSLLSLVTNCIVSMIFYLVFQPLAFFARGAAMILDFFVYYSTNSNSYTGAFIEKGWGVVRDIANIFFILALLYVAFKIILNDSHSNPKKLVSVIIVVALFINFSLFATRIVIDASNILAKIFYNNINSVDASGKVLPPGSQGQKSVTVGLVKTFNPHTIFTKSNIPGGITGNLGKFFAVLVISIMLMFFMIKMFLSIAVIFVSRVISLWFSMIFSPIAFASLTTDMDLKQMGWKGWKDDLFSNAFLAPVFIFFLYLIILFGDFLTISTSGTNSVDVGVGIIKVDDFQTYMKILIPFIIIYVLLTKAKEITVKMSGEMGKTLSGVVNPVAGAAIGAVGGFAIGKAAQLGRGLIGGGANSIATSNWAQKSRFGRAVGGVARSITTKSFDIRDIKVAGKDLSKVAGADFGHAKKGGYVQANKERSDRRMKRAEAMKLKPNAPEVLKVRELKDGLNDLVAEYKHDLTTIDAIIASKKADALEARNNLSLLKDEGKKKGDADFDLAALNKKKTQYEVDNLMAKKKAVKGATVKDENGNDVRGYYKKTVKLDANGNYIKTDQELVRKYEGYSGHDAVAFDEIASKNKNHKVEIKDKDGKGTGKYRQATIDDYSDDLLPHAEHDVEKKNREILTAYSRRIEDVGNQIDQGFWTLWQQSLSSAQQDAFNIRQGVKADAGHGGGGH
ncbi:MAG: hypothetical protein M3Q34_01305 [bacterium]|nr:hypothetical protein [bacterium]